ncbi:hypothetical protein NT6N_26260 [Oceaniferula spumae]|uniref:DUF1795 domain-containing protein n=1 Tax=Oceaniferula spumae TaxID=2979115 RepID=A0AAT9FNI9_9BACT
MKTTPIHSVRIAAFTASILGFPLTNAYSQEAPADVTKPEVTAAAEVTYTKKVFTRGLVTQGKAVMINSYFLLKQTPNNWTHMLSMYLYPKLNDPALYVKNMTANLAKEGVEAEAIPFKDTKLKGLSFFEKNERMIKFNVFIYHTTKNGKLLIGRHFTLRAQPEKEKLFRQLVALQKKEWAQELVSVNFPGFKFPPSNKPDAEVPAKEAGKLHDLKFVKETVDDARAKGKIFNVDADFALKNGSDVAIKVPFSVALPQTDFVMVLGRPKVPETVRFTLSNEKKEYLESIRFTSMTMGTQYPMDVRLQRACAMLESQMVQKFFDGYKDPKIVGRYKTKVGPYNAAVIVSQMTHQDGRKFFVKFVGLLQDGKPDGVAIVLMLNGSVGDPATMKDRLRNGFAQQVLHSIRFTK